MTQRFLDDGRVERVTVLEAGPCPVTAIRTHERDGYEAVQLAFGACKEKVLTKAELGHLKKADASARSPACARIPRRGRRAARWRHRHGRGVLARRPRENLGQVEGQGLSGHDQAPQLRERTEVARFSQLRAPGSIGASATPSRVFKGIRGPGRMGGGRITQRGLTVVEVLPKRNLLLVRGAVPGPKGGTVEVRTDG